MKTMKELRSDALQTAFFCFIAMIAVLIVIFKADVVQYPVYFSKWHFLVVILTTCIAFTCRYLYLEYKQEYQFKRQFVIGTVIGAFVAFFIFAVSLIVPEGVDIPSFGKISVPFIGIFAGFVLSFLISTFLDKFFIGITAGVISESLCYVVWVLSTQEWNPFPVLLILVVKLLILNAIVCSIVPMVVATAEVFFRKKVEQ